ncbi:MAG TPA: enoyl-CoA hydratase-related protein [Pseudonocardia sp.]|nr:enoyl-CoA hydratase-related protein [Pseudonocardia sp.]
MAAPEIGQTDLLVERGERGLVTITLDRPGKRNALTNDMYDGLADTLTTLDSESDVRVVVLTGSGGSFTAGNDLADFVSSVEQAGARPADQDAPVTRFQHAVLRARPLLVAAVDGPAVGIGATLLLHCDLVYATARSYLQTPFVDLGLVPEFASSLLLPQRVGPQRAAELLLFGDRIPAQYAHDLGLVNAVLPDADALHEHVDARVTALLAKPAGALALTRSLLRGYPDERINERSALESTHFTERLASPEAMAIMRGFLKR